MSAALQFKEYYSAAELARLKLSDLPSTKQNILRLAERAKWTAREVTGIGGTRLEFKPPKSVVEQIQLKIAMSIGSDPVVAKLAEQRAVVESDRTRLITDARRGVIQAVERLMARSGYPRKKAVRSMLDLARIGGLEPHVIAGLQAACDPRGRRSPDGLPSVRSVLRFIEYEAQGTLAPQSGRPYTIPAWAAEFLAYYQRPEKPSVQLAYQQFCKAFPIDPPSIHQVYRFLKKLGNVSREMGRMGPRELKALRPFIRRSFDSLVCNDIWSADGHTFDAEVQHPQHGRPFRPEITSIVDIATRRLVGWSIDLSESALAVLDALRHGVLSAGIPAIFYVDNGSGYKNALMRDEGVGLMGRLGVEMVHSLPYNSQARGVIERLHQTVWVTAAKLLPSFVGADMDREARLLNFKLTRQAVKSSKNGTVARLPLISWEAFKRFADEQVAEYNARPHRSLPKITDPQTGRRRHLSPDEAWAAHIASGVDVHRITDDEARPLFRPQMLRTVRRGEISLLGNRYFAEALAEFNGDPMRVSFDIHDAQTVWVYDETGRFVCTADWNGNLRDYKPQSLVELARARRAAGREKRWADQLDEVRLERDGGLAIERCSATELPGLSGSEIAGAFERLQPIETNCDEPPRPAMRVVSEGGFSVPTTPAERYALYGELAADLGAGVWLSEPEQRWLTGYQKTSEFRAMKKRADDTASA